MTCIYSVSEELTQTVFEDDIGYDLAWTPLDQGKA